MRPQDLVAACAYSQFSFLCRCRPVLFLGFLGHRCGLGGSIARYSETDCPLKGSFIAMMVTQEDDRDWKWEVLMFSGVMLMVQFISRLDTTEPALCLVLMTGKRVCTVSEDAVIVSNRNLLLRAPILNDFLSGELLTCSIDIQSSVMPRRICRAHNQVY